ncbi:hypothetical protein HXX76_006636 [Chlamydomonas incerta]|uniref:Uncharacterized protein n=1 Tax=Chlamydomonas incerta TaxID=51695 RepID=A0A835TDP5_CHLIN|nr:hypothetical protein HXX76_006636 [Chlamydomonas incerta]|eukprot:KAG2436326.1 hypothetical protein HXX76_006636 [Chlamydomonas incerta]
MACLLLRAAAYFALPLPLYLQVAAPLCTYAARAAPFASWCLAGPGGPGGAGLSMTSGLVLFRINPVGDAFLALSSEPLIAPAELAFNAFTLVAVWLLTSWHGTHFAHLGAALVPQLLLRLASISVIHTLARYRRGHGRVEAASAAACGARSAEEKTSSRDVALAACAERKDGGMGRLEGLEGEAALQRPDGMRGSASVSQMPSNRGGASTSESSSTGGSSRRSVSCSAGTGEAMYYTTDPGQARHTYTAAADVMADGDAAAAMAAAFESALPWEVAALNAGHSAAGPCDAHATYAAGAGHAGMGASPFLSDPQAAHPLPNEPQQQQQQQQYPGLLPAGAQPAYRSVVRRRTTRIKVPFAEPEQLSPGFMQRLQDVAAQHGVVLAGVYVRPGCIELLLDLEVWSTGSDAGSDASMATGAAGTDFLISSGSGGGAAKDEQERLEQVLMALGLQLQAPAVAAQPQAKEQRRAEQEEQEGLPALRRLMREQPVQVDCADLQATQVPVQLGVTEQPQRAHAQPHSSHGPELPATVLAVKPRVAVAAGLPTPLTLKLRLLAPAASLVPKLITPGGSHAKPSPEPGWNVEALVRCRGEYLPTRLQSFVAANGGGGDVRTGMTEMDAEVQVHMDAPLHTPTVLMVEIRCCGRLGTSAPLLLLGAAELLPDLEAAVAGLAPRPDDLSALLLDVATWLQLTAEGGQGAAATATATACCATPSREALARLGAHLYEYASLHALPVLAACARRGLEAAGLPLPTPFVAGPESLTPGGNLCQNVQQQEQQRVGGPRPEPRAQHQPRRLAPPEQTSGACTSALSGASVSPPQAEADAGAGTGHQPVVQLLRQSLLRAVGWERGAAAEEAAFEAYAAPLVFAHIHFIQAVEALSLAALLFRARHDLLSAANLTSLCGCFAGTLACVCWPLLSRAAFVRLVNGLKVPRYALYMLAKAMIGFLGFPAPPGINAYQLGPAMLVMEGVLLPGSNVLPFRTAALITGAKWPLGVAMMLRSGATHHLPTALWLCGRIVLLALATTAACHTQMRFSFALHRRRMAKAKAQAGVAQGAAGVAPGTQRQGSSKKDQ